MTLFAFVALELCYSNPANPRALAFAISLYSYVALFGMLAFGRDTWMRSRRGLRDSLRVHRRHRTVRRPRGPDPAAHAAHRSRGRRAGTPGSVLFLAVALGSVGFDGYSRTITWQNLVARVEAPYVLNRPGTGELLVTGPQPARAARRDRDRARGVPRRPARSPGRWSRRRGRSRPSSSSPSSRSRSSTRSRTTSRSS